MSNLLKNTNAFADHCGLPARHIFDDLFTLLYSHICAGKKEYQHLYPAVSFDARKVQPLDGYRDADRDELMRLLVMLIAELDNAVPFEDVVTDKYGTLLQGDSGQFMTPTPLSNAVSEFLGSAREGGNKRAEPSCGTGALVMGDLRHTYAVGGKDAVSHVDYSINDLDQRLVRIATVQVMYHSIRHEAPLKRLVVHNADLIRNYDTSPPFVAATSWRGVLEII